MAKKGICTRAAVFLMMAAMLLSGGGDKGETLPGGEEDSAAPEAAVKTEFTQEEFLVDYDQLWADLEENYPFFPVLEEKGIDVEGVRQSGRETIESRVTTLEGFVWVLKVMFGQMRNFAHLDLAAPSIMEVHISGYTEGIQFAQPWYEVICQPQTVATYAQLYDWDMGSGEEYVEDDVYPPVETRYLPEYQAVYFHFPSFHNTLVERDRDVVSDYLDSLGEVEISHVILDITGNMGGNDLYWMDHIVRTLGGGTCWRQDVFLSDTPVNRRFMYPYYAISPISSLPEDYEAPEFVEELGFTQYFPIYVDFSQAEERLPGARRWLLVDRQVYSAADAFAGFCKDTGWATLVGSATSGDGGKGVPPVMIPLKNTGLLIWFSSVAGANSEGQLNTDYGTNPDILSRGGEAPLDTVLRLISSQAG
mgnify:CR=1 FL=1